MNRLSELSLLVQHGENVEAVKCAETLLSEDIAIDKIINAVSQGLFVLKNKCTVENFQLLDVLLASRAMVEVVDECIAKKLKVEMDSLSTNVSSSGSGKLSTIVIGTIQGDVHDLGKHVTATLCRFNGFRVIDLGKDVPVEKFIKAVVEEDAEYVGVSSLMTVCLPRIPTIKDALVEKGLIDVKVVGGGSAVQQGSMEALKLDHLAFDAFEGLDYLTNIDRVAIRP